MKQPLCHDVKRPTRSRQPSRILPSRSVLCGSIIESSTLVAGLTSPGHDLKRPNAAGDRCDFAQRGRPSWLNEMAMHHASNPPRILPRRSVPCVLSQIPWLPDQQHPGHDEKGPNFARTMHDLCHSVVLQRSDFVATTLSLA
ncbi:hypothetical protein ACCO45_003503 [Purpureocillium lilacinum]|uniref:Uncharacterized protein n=1 Tax=Purpureocillium lilacinum TaxID=33203 RepID=A0ACC4E022_PURLI